MLPPGTLIAVGLYLTRTSALVLAALGEHEATLDALRQACDEHARFAIFLGVWPVFDGLRGDPRFAALLRRIRLTHDD